MIVWSFLKATCALVPPSRVDVSRLLIAAAATLGVSVGPRTVVKEEWNVCRATR